MVKKLDKVSPLPYAATFFITLDLNEKILIWAGIVLVGLLIISAWLLFGSATSFTGKSAYVFIRNGQSAEAR